MSAALLFALLLLMLSLPVPGLLTSPSSRLRAGELHPLSSNGIGRPRWLRRPELVVTAEPARSSASLQDRVTAKLSSNLAKRCLTGAVLSALATSLAVSSPGTFTSTLAAASLLAHHEFRAMVLASGRNYPAPLLCATATAMSYVVAWAWPAYHELVMPMVSLLLVARLLSSASRLPTIGELSAPLLGVLYAGLLPSFWVRLRGLEATGRALSPTELMGWWSWCAIASSDMGAYAVGRAMGWHKLGAISPAAGAASPNKTIEGAVGGSLVCTLLMLLGAHRMRWPLWPWTGAAYGLLLSVVALVGDLTASTMKRDAKLKDSGALLPGHGGLLDRMDSYIFTAPVAFFFCKHVLPWTQRWAEVRRV